MDRKEFLQTVWSMALKPLLLIAGMFFCFRFIYLAAVDTGIERLVVICIFGLGLLYTLAYLTGLLFKKAIDRIYNELSVSAKTTIINIVKIMDYLAPIFFGIILYHFWLKDWMLAAFVIGVLLIQEILGTINKVKRVHP